jgi:hypothetical protein
VRKYSHAQHFVDRFLEGYGWEGQWHHPSVDLVALYVDQFPENDLSRDRMKRFNVPIYGTIEEALTRGTSKLAVDGVVIVGEHGCYPRNELDQTLYPRYQWFKQVVDIFERSSRAVPVFNDKHLSTRWPECVEMVADSKRLGFPFLAGSSLPFTWRLPSIDIPLNAPLIESVSVAYGGVDSYDFHALETAQCMSERRAGGETGVKRIHAMRGSQMWEALRQSDSTQKLFSAALSRSHTVKAPPGYTIFPPTIDWARRASPEAIAYFIEHNDGFRTTIFLCSQLVEDFTYAGMTKDGQMLSCQMHLPMPPRSATTADFFNPLAHFIEEMVINHDAPYPIERTLLTSGMTLNAVTSLHRNAPLETKDLNVHYSAPTESLFWKA